MGYKLEKPYTDIQRADFICEHQGFNYYEDNNCIIMYSSSEKIVNGEVVDRTQDADYIAEQKKQLIQQAKDKRDKVIDAVTSSVILDQLQKEVGIITQAIYDSRFAAKANMYQNATNEFYITTGLIATTSIEV